jgi:hypothetical protein
MKRILSILADCKNRWYIYLPPGFKGYVYVCYISQLHIVYDHVTLKCICKLYNFRELLIRSSLTDMSIIEVF